MQRLQDEGFILSTRPLGEADLLVTLLTAEQGKVRAVAPSAKRSRRRFGAALEPLTRVRARWAESEGRELARLESCDILTSYAEAQRDLGRFYLFAYIAEVADVFSRERQADPRYFRLVGAVLDAASGSLPARAARRYFDLWTLRLQGLLPDLAACGACGADPVAGEGDEAVVSLSEGFVLCRRCAAGRPGERIRLKASALLAARRAMKRAPSECAELGGEGAHDGRSAIPGLSGLDALATRSLLRFTERPFRTLRFLSEFV